MLDNFIMMRRCDDNNVNSNGMITTVLNLVNGFLFCVRFFSRSVLLAVTAPRARCVRMLEDAFSKIETLVRRTAIAECHPRAVCALHIENIHFRETKSLNLICIDLERDTPFRGRLPERRRAVRSKQ